MVTLKYVHVKMEDAQKAKRETTDEAHGEKLVTLKYIHVKMENQDIEGGTREEAHAG